MTSCPQDPPPSHPPSSRVAIIMSPGMFYMYFDLFYMCCCVLYAFWYALYMCFGMCYMRFGVFYMRFLYVLCVWVCFISGYDLYHVLILQMSSPQPCVFQYAHSGMHAKKNNASCKLLVKTHLTGYVPTRPAAPVSSCIHQASWLTVSHQPRGCPSVLRAFVMPRPPSMMSPSFSFLARGLQVIPRLEVLRKTRSSNWNVLVWITGYRCSQDFFFLPMFWPPVGTPTPPPPPITK